jgi:hypothetical protein
MPSPGPIIYSMVMDPLAPVIPSQPHRLAHWRRLLGRESGQAMVEYSTFTFFMLVGVTGGSLVTFMPNFMNAMNTYLAGLYYMIDAPIP